MRRRCGDEDDKDDEKEERTTLKGGMRGVHCGDLMRPREENIPSDSDPSTEDGFARKSSSCCLYEPKGTKKQALDDQKAPEIPLDFNPSLEEDFARRPSSCTKKGLQSPRGPTKRDPRQPKIAPREYSTTF